MAYIFNMQPILDAPKILDPNWVRKTLEVDLVGGHTFLFESWQVWNSHSTVNWVCALLVACHVQKISFLPSVLSARWLLGIDFEWDCTWSMKIQIIEKPSD